MFTYSTEKIGLSALIPNGGYVMMVFQRMHLDAGKRN